MQKRSLTVISSRRVDSRQPIRMYICSKGVFINPSRHDLPLCSTLSFIVIEQPEVVGQFGFVFPSVGDALYAANHDKSVVSRQKIARYEEHMLSPVFMALQNTTQSSQEIYDLIRVEAAWPLLIAIFEFIALA